MARQQSAGKVFQAGDNLIWGHHPVLEMINQQPRQISEIFIAKTKEGSKNQEIIDQARNNQVKVKFLKNFTINGAGKINHQGVLARINNTETLSENAFLASLENPAKKPFLLALDSIQDPHNLGAILRSAAAAGVSGVILPRDRSAPLGGTAAKVAAGAMAHLNICQVTNFSSFFKRLQELGVWIYGTVKDKGHPIFSTDLTGPVCLVIGNEEKGIRPLVAQHCDEKITIPMPGDLDSLNASVAAGIVLFEVVRQRHQKSR